MRMAVRIEFAGSGQGGHYQLNGILTFATALEGLALVKPLLRDQPLLRLDLSGITRADSAGVALLIEWLNMARRAGCVLRYTRVPESLQAMMRVGGVEGMLPIDTD